MRGWLPVEIILENYSDLVWPGLVPDASVRWMQLGNRPLSEPFFDDTVHFVRNETDKVGELELDLASILREGKRRPSVLPNGFIFHVSRCGSTLICNALKALEHGQVVAEARSITRLFMPCQVSNVPAADMRWNEECRDLAECLFSLFASYRTGEPEPIVVKFSSPNSICLPVIRKWWPDIPCLFVIRDPVEVMASNMRGGRLHYHAQLPELANAMCGTDARLPLEDMSDEDWFARILGRYFDVALSHRGENVKIIDYVQITRRTIGEIATLFSIKHGVDERCLDAVFDSYSKDPTRTAPFGGDREEKRQAATPAIVAAATRWAMPAYEQLRSEHGQQ